jgi:hypothetical protein
MGRKRDKTRARQSSPARLGREAVLDLLGEARQKSAHPVRFLPVSVWPQNALFVGARDPHLKSLTAGAFPQGPAAQSNSHPLFVLRAVGNLAHRVCPCSSQRFFNQRYIEKGCKLEHTSFVLAERTYLVEECQFQIPKDSAFLWSLRYWGRVPEGCLGRVGDDED